MRSHFWLILDGFVDFEFAADLVEKMADRSGKEVEEFDQSDWGSRFEHIMLEKEIRFTIPLDRIPDRWTEKMMEKAEKRKKQKERQKSPKMASFA